VKDRMINMYTGRCKLYNIHYTATYWPHFHHLIQMSFDA